VQPSRRGCVLREILSLRGIVVSRCAIEMLSLECGEVREILWPSYRSLVPYQCVSAKDKDRNAIEYCGDFAGKSFIRRHATDARQHIYSARGSSELNDLLGLEEIRFLEAGLLEPELVQKPEK
jgi:hypothetical protein